MKTFLILSFLVIACSAAPNHNSNKDMGADSSQSMNRILAEDVKYAVDSTFGIENSPDGIALKFINAYVEHCNNNEDSVGIMEWVNNCKMTTPLFNEDLKRILDEAYKADPEMGLDVDPIFNAQDYPEKGFEFVSFDKKSLMVMLKGKDWPEYKLKVQVGFLNGYWLVNGCGMIYMFGQ